jgi:hypothetical protein
MPECNLFVPVKCGGHADRTSKGMKNNEKFESVAPSTCNQMRIHLFIHLNHSKNAGNLCTTISDYP